MKSIILVLTLLAFHAVLISCTQPENAISSDTYFKAGQEYARIGNQGKAKKNYLRALETDPLNDGAHYSLGVMSATAQDLPDALTHFKAAFEIDPQNENYLIGLGVIYGQTGKWKEAIRQFREGVKNSPDKPILHYNLGLALAGGGKVEEAIKSYKKANEIDPDFLLPYINLGALYLNLKNYKKSIEVLKRADSSAPGTEGIKLLLGTALLKNGNYKLSEKEFDRVLSLNPKSGIGHYNKGILQEKRKDFDNAVKSFLAATKTRPNFAQPYNRVAYIYAKLGEKLDTAVGLVEKALKLDNKHRPEYLDTLSWIYYKKEEYKTAGKFITEALKDIPGSDVSEAKKYHAGMIFFKKGEYKKARRFLSDISVGKNNRKIVEESRNTLKIIDGKS